jgi:chromosomal replication initiator protein
MIEAESAWENITKHLRSTLGEAAWSSCFLSVEAVFPHEHEIILKAPSAVARERIQFRYLQMIKDLLSQQTAGSISVRLDIASPQDSPTVFAPRTKSARSQPLKNRSPLFDEAELAPKAQTTDRSSLFDPKYRFESFVIGSSNRFAHAAALSVAEAPSGSYNPLFIHGEAGLGKTHLLNAIGSYVREQYPHLYAKYVSTEVFLNEFIEAIRKNRMSEFKTRYRECDILLIDDIQFLENKEAFQEEFFHTFNSLYGANRQIVITSDRPPRAMSTLEDRLRSRFVMGLITDIQPPDVETRMAIVQRKADDYRLTLPPEVVTYISESIRDNIRELEGALTRVAAYSRLTHHPIDLPTTQEVLADLLSDPNNQHRIRPKEIIEVTAKFYAIELSDILGESRKRPLAHARQIAMYLVREMTDLSYPAIGKEFGGRDHTTVMHAVDKISLMLQNSPELYRDLQELTQRLRGARGPHSTTLYNTVDK